MTRAEQLLALAERVDATGPDNSLDVEVEIALFKPDWRWSAIRANAAGSKVIVTSSISGRETTYRAWDWTLAPEKTAASLRAIAAQEESA